MPQIDLLKSFLRSTGFFRSLGEKSLTAIAEICVVRRLPKGGILFLEGDEGQALFLCQSGDIRLYKTAPDGRETDIKLIQSGELFGEVILFRENCYPVSARALTTSSLFVLPRLKFMDLLSQESFRNDFISMLLEKQRYLAERIIYLSCHDVDERLLRFLEEQSRRGNNNLAGLSKKDIAAIIGTTPESLSRTIRRLEENNRLRWGEQKIEIL